MFRPRYQEATSAAPKSVLRVLCKGTMWYNVGIEAASNGEVLTPMITNITPPVAVEDVLSVKW
jgi:hypothetical protein